MPKKYSVGVDLGGTSIKFGLVDHSGKILRKVSLPSLALNGPDAVIKQIFKGIKEVSKGYKEKIIGIGIGAPGAVKLKKGTVENPPNFPGWNKVHLGSKIKKEFKCDVFVENDANAAAIGELIYGAGKSLDNFIMITLGTGVGGGIIVNKKLFRGETGGAGEIGHTSIDYNGLQCKCGSVGCIEAYIGNGYLIKRAQEILSANPSEIINSLTGNDINSLTPKIINIAAQSGDLSAKQIIEDTGVKLGYALASIVNALDIANVIIGGGVAGFGKPLFLAAQTTIKSRVLKSFKSRITVKPAKLKNDAGIKGASALVFYKS